MSNVTLSLLISFLAGISTFIGGLVVFIKFKDKNKFLAFSLSFSLSVMLSISVFELIPESIMTLLNRMSFLLAFLSGLFMFILGKILVNKINYKTHLLSGNSLYRVGVLSMIALMIHNFPEGIATFMASYNDISTGISLGIAIMLHNIPEGISIAVPVYYATGSKKRGLFLTLVSGLAEPLGAFVSYILLKNYINDVTISLVLILVAGIMMSLSIDEMIPEVNKYDNKVISIMKDNIKSRFSSKGKKIIDINNKVVDNSLKYLKRVSIDSSWVNLEYSDNKKLNFNETINLLKGDTLPVSSFLDVSNGVFEGGTTKNEKRNIAESIPNWIPENCSECNKCAFACPHGVIRPFLLDKDDKKIESIPSIMPKDVNFAIGINYEECTGCGLCAVTCPGKMGKKALEMVSNKRHDKEFDYLLKSNINDKYDSNILTSRNISFRTPKFEYSGACAGCGETPYLTNLTRVFNDNLVIANATGCSSIYGGSTPSFPYSIPWASSLFEDNAEYGYGILNGINMKRNKIKKYMKEYPRNKVFKKWLNNMNNYDICKEVYKEIDYKKHPYLNDMKDYIVPKSMWIVGGDGFAYDIGYDGIDHVLSKNDNINIMVLDTEVYSNTGGQASKSSNYGATASFASSGKNNYKKDLARIAMCYPHVYVASCNIGYNNEQYLKALKEASSYDGPSIIICYSPCIEHGIKSGMEHSQSNAYLATECGYFITFRYNPSTGKLILDSKNPDFNKYEDYLMTENRFANLKNVNSDNANMILEEQKKWAMNRFNYYKRISEE